MWNWTVAMTSGQTVTVEGADAYQPEGPLTTFFCTGSNRLALDSWSTRVASYRTADIIAVERQGAEAHQLNTVSGTTTGADTEHQPHYLDSRSPALL